MHYEEEACHIENRSSFHSFGPEYVKVFLKGSVFAFGICNFSLTTFWREKASLWRAFLASYTVALHESSTRNTLLGPLLNNTEVYLTPFISTQNHTIACFKSIYLPSMLVTNI
jgi:hypothetical protein